MGWPLSDSALRWGRRPLWLFLLELREVIFDFLNHVVLLCILLDRGAYGFHHFVLIWVVLKIQRGVGRLMRFFIAVKVRQFSLSLLEKCWRWALGNHSQPTIRLEVLDRGYILIALNTLIVFELAAVIIWEWLVFDCQLLSRERWFACYSLLPLQPP